MPDVGIKELLEAGVHFGHQTRRWNPRMRRYIFGERGGIHIIDLQQTEALLAEARDFAAAVAGRGGTVLFVGTKKQATDAVREVATEAGMPYVDQRWLGGLLTNFGTISGRIDRLHELTRWREDGTLDLLPVRERIAAESELAKLEVNLGGVRNMQRVPDAVFIIDLKTETIALREAERLNLPIVALVDSNVDPGPVSCPIPGNDDAIRSCRLIVEAIGDVVRDSAGRFRAEEERARREAEEQARREREERERREAEEQARREAAEQAARDAEERGPGPEIEAEPQVAASGDAQPVAATQADSARSRAPAQASPTASDRQAAPGQATEAAAPAEAAQANEVPEDRPSQADREEARS
ncbi:MAG TPA: 30S ribosomal protein S2 [Thermoleophilaceae bacterium]|nr:30S ribosomal protein S2 [Thermoleophilaceae bacterium]